MFHVLQFTGHGDPFFGGSADDRALYLTQEGLAFLTGWDAQRRAFHGETIAEAVFPTHGAAERGAEGAQGRVAGSPLAVID